LNGVSQPAPVGQCSGGHQPALSHQGGTGGRGPQLGPELVDVRPPPLGSVAIGQHGMLLSASSELAEVLESVGRGPPVAHPVVGQTEEFNHLGHMRRPFDKGVKDAAGLSKALIFKGACCLPESGRGTPTRSVAQDTTQHGVRVGQSERCPGQGLPIVGLRWSTVPDDLPTTRDGLNGFRLKPIGMFPNCRGWAL